MTVSVTPPINISVANGVTDTFPYNFRVLEAAHMRVTVNGLLRTQGVHYTISGIGTDSGNIVFTVGNVPANGAIVMRRRLMPFERSTDYVNLGDLLASTLNADQDAPVMMIQQLAALSMQLTEDGNGGFVWDAQGNRIINLGSGINPTDAANLGNVLTLIEQMQTGGGVVGVQPKKWDILSDEDGTIDFPLVGADVDNPLLYLVYVGDDLLEPTDEFQILAGDTATDRVLRIPAGVADGVGGFVVLVGYARPWTGDPPITTVAPTIITDVTEIIAGTPVDSAFHNTLIVINEATPVTVNIRQNTGAANDWKDGQYFSVVQLGAGQVTLAPLGVGASILPSPGFNAKTRGVGSVITGTCYFPDGDDWLASGDLERIAATPELIVLPIYDHSALNTTNITTGTGKGNFIMPFGMVLETIANRGCYASLLVAQAAGSVLTVDVNRNGTSIISTKLTFDNAEKTTTTAATPAVYASGGDVLAAGDEIAIDVDQVGTALAKGLVVYLVGRRAS